MVHNYTIGINHDIIAGFTHDKADGLAVCLDLAAAAVRAADMPSPPPMDTREIYCHGCGKVKVALLDGILRLHPSAKILCGRCQPDKKQSAENIDFLRQMFGG